jgi:predicted anti-sigma-YlaC factor YlaD
MDHKAIQKKLLRYLDDELSEQEKVKVQRHLERCETCREALQTIELMWATERPIERKTAPPFLWTRIAARLQSQTELEIFKGLGNPVRWVLRPVMTVVVLLFIFFSGIQLGNLMTGNTGKASALSTEKVTDNFGMNYFEILPPGSIDANILALTESER